MIKALSQYQQNETYNEAVRKALMEKTQQLKESEERQEAQQKKLLDAKKKLDDEMKKKRIIYI